MNIPLRERNLDPIVSQSLVDDLIGSGNIGIPLVDQNVLLDEQIHTAVPKSVQSQLDPV